MIAFLSLLLHVVVSPFKTKARLEAEIVLLRHQLNVLRRRVPSNPKLAGWIEEARVALAAASAR